MAFSFIQGVAANEAAASSTTIGVNITVANPGHLLVCLGRCAGTPSTIVVSDNSGSNTWASVAALQTPTGASASSQMYYCANALAGTYQIKATFNPTSTARSITVLEYSGVALTSPLDANAAGASTAAGSTFTSGTFSTTHQNELAVVMGTVDATGAGFTAGTIAGVTATQRSGSGVIANDMFAEDVTLSAIETSVTGSMTSSSSVDWSISVGTFLPAGASKVFHMGGVLTAGGIAVFN